MMITTNCPECCVPKRKKRSELVVNVHRENRSRIYIGHDYALQLIKKVLVQMVFNIVAGFVWLTTPKKAYTHTQTNHFSSRVLQNVNRNKSKQVRNMHNAEVSWLFV